MISHGVATVRNTTRLDGDPRQSLHPGRLIVLSNGLIHQLKGIEFVLRAMPAIAAAVPHAVYLVHGIPHPSGIGTREYYRELQVEAAPLIASGHVVFKDEYSSEQDLLLLLRNTAVYVNAYVDSDQAVSGTLAMAVGCGTVCVSTPYSFAVETLTTGGTIGHLVPYRDSDAIAAAVIDVLTNVTKRRQMSELSFAKAQSMSWDNIARKHLEILYKM